MHSNADISGRSSLRLVQITDTHLYGNPGQALLGLNTQHSFERVVDLIDGGQKVPDLIVGTGDISQDGSKASYQRFAQGIQKLNAPFYWIPGNHDSREVMRSLSQYPGASANRIVCGNWQILMLDTSVENQVHGLLAAPELDRLERQLSQLDDDVEHTMICLHHNPMPGNSSWMKDIGLKNMDEFFALLKKYPDSIRAVVHGHIHQALDYIHEGIRFFCTPSTCVQFKPYVKDFELEMLAPAYRWFDLHADGSVDSAVERLKDYTIRVDMQAGGY